MRELTRRLLWRLETRLGLASMFAVALLVQILVAPHTGAVSDLALFERWTARLAEVGTRDFYVDGQFVDYPPGYLYLLWLTGKLTATPGYLALKLPPILADLGLAWIAGVFAARLAPASLLEKWPVRALVTAGVLFNPAVLAVGSVWGQVDSVPAFFVLASLLVLYTGKPGLRSALPALLLFAVAITMKPQTGFVFPAMLYALYRRYIHGRPRGEAVSGLLRVALAGTLALGVWAVSGLAFGLGPWALINFYSESAAVYPVTSANAFNFWGVVGFWRSDGSGVALIGVLVFFTATGYVISRAHRTIESGAPEALILAVASATIALVGYVVLTRMHERYMFVALAMLAPLAFVRPFRLVYAALSALFVLNLWYGYAYLNVGNAAGQPVGDFHWDPPFNWLFGPVFEADTAQKKLWSLAVTLIVALIVSRGMGWVGRTYNRHTATEAPSR